VQLTTRTHEPHPIFSSQLIPAIRERLLSIATQAATAADALADAEAIDLDPHALADMLLRLDSVAARVSGICDRLAGALGPARIAG
jgi:hypothetical protein